MGPQHGLGKSTLATSGWGLLALGTASRIGPFCLSSFDFEPSAFDSLCLRHPSSPLFNFIHHVLGCIKDYELVFQFFDQVS